MMIIGQVRFRADCCNGMEGDPVNVELLPLSPVVLEIFSDVSVNE